MNFRSRVNEDTAVCKTSYTVQFSGQDESSPTVLTPALPIPGDSEPAGTLFADVAPCDESVDDYKTGTVQADRNGQRQTNYAQVLGDLFLAGTKANMVIKRPGWIERDHSLQAILG